MAFFTASYQQLLWAPTQSGAPSPFGLVWLSLPHLVYNSVRSLTATDLISVLTELYNSSTSTRSSTRSLKSHVWSSSSGNNCHAVHRSLFRCISLWVYHGNFFTSSHFVSQFPPTWFPLITAIRICHLLPVHHLGMAFLAGSKAKIQQIDRYRDRDRETDRERERKRDRETERWRNWNNIFDFYHILYFAMVGWLVGFTAYQPFSSHLMPN